MSRKYSVGVDFGTLSARAVLVGLDTGSEIATATMDYPHGVMDACLPDGVTRLGPDWALQHPQDYLDTLSFTVNSVLQKAGADSADVVGIGIDFTACTVLPTLADGTPLCMLEEFSSNPHAYVKLWKHHAAQDQANRINAVARSRNEPWLGRYGGKLSSEWMLAKALQVLEEAPEVYARMERFMEAADWIVMQLCGRERRSACTAGYKAGWSKREGYASKEFFAAVDARFEGFVSEKLSEDIYPIGAKAGQVTQKAAALTGLCPGTAVAVANVDAHVALPPVGIVDDGKMLMIMGTSTCHIVLGKEEKTVPGMCGVVEDGVVPGYFGYEAGQSCVGDHFAWFIENCLPAEYTREANLRGLNMHKFLRERAAALKPGESGLVALDWWNGNRSVLVDVDLTGLIAGMSLSTKPEEIYRALIEATAYGTRMIIDTFEESGVPVRELYAAGGIAEKDEMMMQIYSDVTNRVIRISGSPQAPALGSAMFGAVAAGKMAGGFDTIKEAAEVAARLKDTVYRPIPENVGIYDSLYAEYKLLHDYFGRGENDVMKRLRALRGRVRGQA